MIQSALGLKNARLNIFNDCVKIDQFIIILSGTYQKVNRLTRCFNICLKNDTTLVYQLVMHHLAQPYWRHNSMAVSVFPSISIIYKWFCSDRWRCCNGLKRWDFMEEPQQLFLNPASAASNPVPALMWRFIFWVVTSVIEEKTEKSVQIREIKFIS